MTVSRLSSMQSCWLDSCSMASWLDIEPQRQINTLSLRSLFNNDTVIHCAKHLGIKITSIGDWVPTCRCEPVILLLCDPLAAITSVTCKGEFPGGKLPVSVYEYLWQVVNKKK